MTLVKWHVEVLEQLIKKDFKIKYKNTVLGYIWSLGTPLIMAIIFDVAFRHVMRINMENYSVFLISGLFAWQWVSNGLNGSCWAFLGNMTLIKKLVFPKYYIPLSLILIDGIHFALSVPIISLFLYIHDLPAFYWSWLYQIPIVFLLQMLICYGLALVIASCNMLFRDIERVTTLVVMLLMYLTPILYPLDLVPSEFVLYFSLNPLLYLIESWHEIFLHGTLPLLNVECMSLSALVSVIFGMYVYRVISPKFAELG
ncbi:ABC transporter permease [Marinomonas balearica]|uniref:Transport permease protein n=1 Tax=Marinomonas balearica TaxID=491947 RepID=A0A4R6M9A6_9GAMM|nr:ABC transporter permease [Marinomonas balearica]TDO97200.1 lipopolysaccharide transport system permease protein [Marinomonas balearica]